MKFKQKLNLKLIGYLSTFEKVTRTNAVDFFENKGQLIFLTEEGTIKKAVGKGGANIKRLSYMLKRTIKIIELSEDPNKFLLSLIYPIKPATMEKTDTMINVRLNSSDEKARIIGRASSNLEFINSLLERHYGLKMRLV